MCRPIPICFPMETLVADAIATAARQGFVLQFRNGRCFLRRPRGRQPQRHLRQPAPMHG